MGLAVRGGVRWVRRVSKGEPIVSSRVKTSRPRGYIFYGNSARTSLDNHHITSRA